MDFLESYFLGTFALSTTRPRMTMSALLVVAILTITISSYPITENASAQENISIKTSADDHANRFFGEGILQVTVTDPNADDDSSIEEISIEINADGAGSSSIDIAVPETNEGSGRFEFFLRHVDATAVAADELDSINAAGVEDDGTCLTDCAPLVTFGPGGDVDVDTSLYDEMQFELLVGNTEAVVEYEGSSGRLVLDRDSYGTTSYVYISVVDQDANLNPTERDQITIDPESDPNDDLLELNGGTIQDSIVYGETGDNTAIFEGRNRLGESIVVESESIALILFEKANYNATLAASENDSNDSDEVGFTVGNSDGTIDVGGDDQMGLAWDPMLVVDKDSYLVGDMVHLTITDKDANINSATTDSIQLQVSSNRGQIIEISGLETSTSSGIFEASFLLSEETDAESNTIATGGSLTITYIDERPADYFDRLQTGQDPEKEFSLEIDVQLPIRTGIESTDVTTPLIADMAGNSGPYVAGSSLTLSTSIANNNEQLQPFVVLFEVRDSNDVTVFLAFQSGTLDPNGSVGIGVLWQPPNGGAFEVRSFAITEIGTAAGVLSTVAKSDLLVT